jgi:hypothetical protein
MYSNSVESLLKYSEPVDHHPASSYFDKAKLEKAPADF